VGYGRADGSGEAVKVHIQWGTPHTIRDESNKPIAECFDMDIAQVIAHAVNAADRFDPDEEDTLG